MENEKIFSIVIPVYNGEKTIERTLASLIGNKEWIYEVVIVNDHSTDNSLEKIEPFKQWLPIKVIENTGLHNASMARKTGMLACSGQWIGFLDADDCYNTLGLRYVKQRIDDDKSLLVIVPLRVYYNEGLFGPEYIHYLELSCIGNFYKLDYLMENKLFPAEDLKLAEDEYFGKKIFTYLHYVDHNESATAFLPFPVYHIYHEDKNSSLSYTNWLNYILQYHLVSFQMLTDDFLQYPDLLYFLTQNYISNFIQSYFTYLLLLETKKYKGTELSKQLQYFKNALQYAEENLNITPENFIYFYHNEDNKDTIDEILQLAEYTTGQELPEKHDYNFDKFIDIVQCYDTNFFNHNSSS